MGKGSKRRPGLNGKKWTEAWERVFASPIVGECGDCGATLRENNHVEHRCTKPAEIRQERPDWVKDEEGKWRYEPQ